MPNVHILPSEVISKIAAGEIIERPASVIKELIENAFDAGSKNIEVHLKDAGKTLIHIKDAGSGIAQDDLETIFLRHATSKLSKIDDLNKIHSLGFRGEALYSIAAIADVVLRSKTQDQDSGWEIHVRGGKKLNLKPVTMPAGTELEIKELFFNTPARKKFLKSNTTEINQILNTFVPYTLLYPDCRFKLKHQGRDLIDLTPAESIAGRIAHALNLDQKHFIEAKQEFPDNDISIHMVLGDINIKRARRDMQFIFVNGRPVQNRNIGFHINQIYRLIFPPEYYPFFAIYIHLPADEIDVNIHPAKREIKIKDERLVASMLRKMCEKSLMTQGEAKQVAAAPGAAKTNHVERALMGLHTSEMAFESNIPSDLSEAMSQEALKEPGSQDFSYPAAEHWRVPEVNEDFFKEKKENLQGKLTRSRYIGSFIKKFLFFETDTSLLVIDQHAAQERIVYEQLIRQMKEGKLEVQHLLSPVLVKVTQQEILFWEEAQEKLEELGLSSTQWDNQTIAIHTHPQLLKDIESAVRHLLSGENVAHCDHDTIARRACRSSVMAGDSMNQKQAEYQRDQLVKCSDPFTCPHGRPTVIEMSENFLDKQFLRK